MLNAKHLAACTARNGSYARRSVVLQRPPLPPLIPTQKSCKSSAHSHLVCPRTPSQNITAKRSPRSISLEMDATGKVRKRCNVARQVSHRFIPILKNPDIQPSHTAWHDPHRLRALSTPSRPPKRARTQFKTRVRKGAFLAERLHSRIGPCCNAPSGVRLTVMN